MKEYYCSRIEKGPYIDGNVDKKEWQAAGAVYLVDTVTGCTPRQPTWVKMLWDDQYLYVAFKCTDNCIAASMTKYNDKLYEEEVVEVFIDDDKDGKTYIEIEVNPLNAVLHYCVHNDLKGGKIFFARIDKTVETAVSRDDEKGTWNAEIAIPLTEFVTAEKIPPEKGCSWHMNLYRIDRVKTGNDEYSAWSPTGKINYHMPKKFGKLIFAD